MSDDRPKKPATPRGVPVVRVTEKQGNHAHRDHRRQPSQSDAISDAFKDEDITKQHAIGELTDEEFHTRRAARPTAVRLARLEKDRDEMQKDFGGRLVRVEVAVADMGGQMKILPQLVEAMQNATTAMQQREHVTLTAKVEVDKAQALGAVEVDTAQKLGEVEVKKTKWKLVLKAAAIIAAAVTAIGAAFAAGRC